MKESLKIIKDLFTTYKDNDYVIKKLNDKIKNTLPIEVLAWKYESEKKHNKSKINEFISNFFLEKTYYYSKKQNLFVVYDGKDYKEISEDNLLFEILEKITTIKELQEKKQEIKDIIMEKIKKNSFKHSIPESMTIQTIINYLHPVIFKTKEETKYFLCILGDNILRKTKNEFNYIISEKAEKFIKHIGDCYSDYFNNKVIIQNFLKSYKYKIKNRLLDFNFNVANELCWKFFIDNFILNLVAVAQHYSIRYDNSEKYLKNRIENQKKILLFDNYDENNNTNISLINYFYNKCIDLDMNSYVTIEELYYLLRSFLNKENIPFMFSKEDIIKKLVVFFETNGIVVDDNKIKNISNKKIGLLRDFNKFWKDCINKDMNEELEVSELKYLFKLEKKKNFEEEDIKDILYYMYNISLWNKKKLVGYSSILWDKKNSIKEALKKCSIKITSDHIDLYKQYCKCLKDSDNDFIVSKSYFMKNIKNIIIEFANSS